MTPADLSALFEQLKSFSALPGFVALVALVIGVAKQLKIIADGDAGKLSLVLNLAGAVGLFWYVQSGGTAEQADTLFGELAQIGAAIVALVLQVGGSKLVYLLGKWAGVPVLGKSLTQ